MPKFNKPAIRKVSLANLTHNAINRGGGLAFNDSPKMALYRQVATSLWSGDGYYEKQAEWFERFQRNVKAVAASDPRFPFALAAYARDKRGLALRTSPVALYVEAAAQEATKKTGYIRQYAPRVLLRADEPGEAIAYFKAHHKGVVPHGLVRGISDVLRNLSAYELGKYKGGAITMRDVLRIARPKPRSDEERALWGKVVERDLSAPYTWEVEISKCHTLDEKRDKWNELLASGKLGLFATVRNLRNMLDCGADIEVALSSITAERVVGSGILPFQWYKSYLALRERSEEIALTMQQAVEWSVANVPRLRGTTLVACDNSSSMNAGQSRGMSNKDVGNLLGAMALYFSEKGIAGTFGDAFATADTRLEYGIFRNKALIDECGQRTGHSTNAWTIFAALTRARVHVDRVIILSDMQCYDSGARLAQGYGGHTLATELETYQKVNPGVIVYSVNLATNDNTCQFSPNHPVVELAGFSESIFQFIAAMEAGESITDWIGQNY